MEDDSYEEVLDFLMAGTLPTEFTSTKSNFIATSNKFSLNRKNLLLRQGKLVLKKSEIETVFKQVHQHSGRDITYKKFQSRFWFRGMYVWVQKKVKECVPCSNKNNPQWPAQRTPLIPIPVNPQMWWRVHVDLIGPLPESSSRNKYIAIAVCSFSKYLEAKGNYYSTNFISQKFSGKKNPKLQNSVSQNFFSKKSTKIHLTKIFWEKKSPNFKIPSHKIFLEKSTKIHLTKIFWEKKSPNFKIPSHKIFLEKSTKIHLTKIFWEKKSPNFKIPSHKIFLAKKVQKSISQKFSGEKKSPNFKIPSHKIFLSFLIQIFIP